MQTSDLTKDKFITKWIPREEVAFVLLASVVSGGGVRVAVVAIGVAVVGMAIGKVAVGVAMVVALVVEVVGVSSGSSIGLRSCLSFRSSLSLSRPLAIVVAVVPRVVAKVNSGGVRVALVGMAIG